MKYLPALLCIAAFLTLSGCGKSQSSQIEKADALAVSDPDAKARQLMQQFTDADDQKTWVQQNTFALTVFQNVKDPQLKADYNAKIVPFLAAK